MALFDGFRGTIPGESQRGQYSVPFALLRRDSLRWYRCRDRRKDKGYERMLHNQERKDIVIENNEGNTEDVINKVVVSNKKKKKIIKLKKELG